MSDAVELEKMAEFLKSCVAQAGKEIAPAGTVSALSAALRERDDARQRVREIAMEVTAERERERAEIVAQTERVRVFMSKEQERRAAAEREVAKLASEYEALLHARDEQGWRADRAESAAEGLRKRVLAKAASLDDLVRDETGGEWDEGYQAAAKQISIDLRKLLTPPPPKRREREGRGRP
jgi:hypothetical protein